MKLNNILQENGYTYPTSNKTITLYRGLSREFDPTYDNSTLDSPTGYSCWSDTPELARAYAGDDGYVYKIELPLKELGDTFITDDGDRPLFYKSDHGANINGARGQEYMIYHDHENFSPDSIKLTDY
jgi:hypothetical protein